MVRSIATQVNGIARRHLEHVDRLDQRALRDRRDAPGRANCRRACGPCAAETRAARRAARACRSARPSRRAPPDWRSSSRCCTRALARLRRSAHRAPEEVLHHAPRQRIGRNDALERLLEIGIAVELHPVAAFDEEVDDLAGLHIEQRRQLRARRHQGVEVDLGRSEVHAEVARAVTHGVARHELAADEMVDLNRNLRSSFLGLDLRVDRVHDTPLT